MSKEHIWGKWLKDYVRQGLFKHGMFTQVVNRPGTPNTENLHIKSGDPLQSKVRVVCAKCNNEWMSEIQDRAKPHLIPLFTGTTRVLGVEAHNRENRRYCVRKQRGEALRHGPLVDQANS